MVDFAEYARLISATPNAIRAKIRTVEKLVDKIRKYGRNTDDLHLKCLYFIRIELLKKKKKKIFMNLFYFFIVKSKMRKLDNNKQRIHLIHEFKLRSAHNQYQINSVKQIIEGFLRQNYEKKYDDLIEVIPKLNRFMIHCKQKPENHEKLACPEGILNMDLTKHVKQYLDESLNIRPITLEENFKYRNLIENENTDKIVSLTKIPTEMRDEEREEKLYKKFHDHLIK